MTVLWRSRSASRPSHAELSAERKTADSVDNRRPRLRTPALFDKQAPGATELSVEPTAGQFAARRDLAAAMLTEARSTAHLHKVLYISSLEGLPSIWRTVWQDAIRKKH